ncbi:hypothetical protein [Butyrivibrio sp. XPD2006]|uniref:hypothetical protein n=1 Tax=Butyrivibrio sp. XPD2006 TaxID=1280668 RepID=UPI0012DE7D60|nr:hypothetical protein [Butyrivibrio sp. XPD2006]
MKNIFKKTYVEDRKLFIFATIITLIGAFFFFWSFNYIDGQTITAWSVNNWDLLVEGRWQDFYLDKAMNTRGAAPIHSDMTQEGMTSPFMYILQSIWCLPLWLTHYFNGNMNVGTIGCVYWYKALLFLTIVLMAYFCYRITKRVSGSDYNGVLAGFIVLASSEVMLSAGYSGQDEVIYLCAMVLALDFLLRDKMMAFVLLSMYAVTLCPMIIIAILPMLLIKQKNVLRVLADAVVMFIPTLLWAVVSSGFEQKSTSSTMNDQLARTFDYIQIPIISGKASLMVIVFVVVCFLSYVTKPDMDDKRMIWISSLMMVYMSFFNDNLFYRSLLYVPFVAILMCCNAGGAKAGTNAGSGADTTLDMKLLLMTVLSYLRFFALGIDSPMHMNTRYTQDNKAIVALCKAFGSDKYQQSDPLVTKIIEKAPSLHDLASAINGVCVAAVLLLLWITFSEENEKRIAGATKILDRRVLIVLYGLCVPIYIVLFYAVILY